MKWRSLYIAGSLVLAGLLTACSSGGGQNGVTPVTVTVGGGSAAHKAAYGLAKTSKAVPAVASITFTVSGPGMDTIVRVVPVTPPQTITEVFFIQNGPLRNFTIEAKDGSDTVIYSGYVLANLDGEPMTLTLPLQTMIFNRLIWSPWGDEATAIARDVNTGDLIVVGHTYGDLEGNMNADPTHLSTDVFVSRVTATGGRIWTKQFGSTGFDACYSATTDSAGNIYMAGSTDGDLETQTRTGRTDAFVTKLDASGNRLWTRLTGTTGYFTFGNAVTVDDGGNIYIAGNTEGGLVSAQSGTVIANQDPLNIRDNLTQDPLLKNTYDAFVVKYDTDGNPLWTQQLGAAGARVNDTAEGIAFSPAAAGPSSVIVTGSTVGSLGGANQGLTDMYVVKLDAVTGTIVWLPQQLGTVDADDAWGVAVDQSTGDIYVAGGTYGGLDGNTNADPSGASEDLFIVKYDTTGLKQWTRQLGSIGNEVATGITFSSNGGGVIVTGYTDGDLDLQGSAGLNDMFMVRYDPFGAWIVTEQFGTKAEDFGKSVVSDNNGNITVLGNTYGGFTSSATKDMFLQQYQFPLP